jgi:hypothetical protein
MILASLKFSPSSTWLAWLVWIAIAACAGGICIFVGLLLETLAEKEWFPTFANFKLWKSLKRCGEIGVLIGVFLEIVSTGVFAIRGEIEIRQIRADAAKHDPHNLPIQSVSAYAQIEFRPLEPMNNEFNGVVKLEMGRASEISPANWDKWGTTEELSDNVTRGNDGNGIFGYDLYFGGYWGDKPHSLFNNPNSLTPDDVDAIALILPIHCEILRGRLEMTLTTLNGSVKKDFTIPAQTSFISVITSIETNGMFVPFDFPSNSPKK